MNMISALCFLQLFMAVKIHGALAREFDFSFGVSLLLFYKTSSVCIISAVEVPAVPSASQFQSEARVKTLLDNSLYNVPTGPRETFLRFTRPSGNNWQLNCEATTTTFTCSVNIARLFVVIHTSVQVSNSFMTPFLRQY